MTLPTSGGISMAQIAAELGLSLPLSSIDPRVLALAGKSTPPVTMPTDFYGRSASGAAPAFSVSKTDASGSAISTTAGGTVSCAPSVQEMGGTAPYARTWSFTSNGGSATLANPNSATCTVSKSFAKQSTGSLDAVLQCVSTDSAGGSITVTGINAHLEWSGTQ